MTKMSWMLKVTEGPLKGAEIALVDGMRVKVGSADTCDIVIADATLAGEAFDLDVAPAAVTLVEPDGKAVELLPFEARSFGTTTFAVGPEDGDWTKVAKREEPKPAEETHTEEKPREEAAPEPSEAGKPAEPEPKEEGSRRGIGCGCLLAAIIVFIILVLLFVLLPRYVSEGTNAGVDRMRPYSEKAWNTCAGLFEKAQPARDADVATVRPQKAASTQPLADLAAEYGLSFATDGATPMLSGNLKRRTERLAIRALALASDPSVRFDLTDDETLKTATDELLFACTDGQIKAVAASNRVVTLRGYAPDAASLERTVRALDADVPGIDRLDTTRVMVGGPAPEPAESAAEEEDEPETPTPVLKRKRPSRAKLAAAKPDYPVAGVLTKPYPCVVLRNGMRLCEGAMVGTAEIVKIEADKLTLRDGGRTFEWEP